MRIAIVHENWGAGAARCARDLETMLGRRHEVLFFPRKGPETVASLFEGLSAFKPEVVNCHSFYGDLPYGTLAEISRRWPTCFTVHDPRPVGSIETVCWSCTHNSWCLACPMVRSGWRRVVKNHFLRERIRKRLSHARSARGLRVVAPSEWIAGRLREQELKRFEMRTIPYGIDLEKFRPAAPDRRKFGLPEQGIILLHSAWHSGSWTLNERKGLPHLAEAFIKTVVPKFPTAILAVAGENLVPNHPNVRPLGMVKQDDLPALLCAVDVFVTPTLADNLPYTVLEAMACGRTVVASRVGGTPEQIVEGETGLLVPPANAAALGEALVGLMSNPEHIIDFGKAARRRAEQLYGMEKFIQAYETLFGEMLRS